MRRLIGLALLLSGCQPERQPIPAGERVICSEGIECRSIEIGQTLIRGWQGEPLFTELVTDNPAAFENVDTLSAALGRAGARLTPDFSSTPRMCETEPTDKIIQAQFDQRIAMETYMGLCNDEAIVIYRVVIKADGTIACIENAFSVICP